MSQPPSISVIIRTFNSAATLEKLLTRLNLKLDDEIIIVDSGSTDRTLEIASRHRTRILTTLRPFNYSRSLNEGFECACNSWVLVISSHCIPVIDDLLDRMRHAVEPAPARLAVAYGKLSLSTPKIIEEGVEFGVLDDWVEKRFRIGGNGLALYRKEFWNQHRFDESLPTAEDVAWFLWAADRGYLAATVKHALVLYRNQGSLRHMFNKGRLETQLAYVLLRRPPPARSYMQKLCSFLVNLAHLARLLFKREISFHTWTRQTAHACGIFRATMTRKGYTLATQAES